MGSRVVTGLLLGCRLTGLAQGRARLRERFEMRRRQRAQQAADKAAAYELVER
jgi:hypothetical protein